MATELNIGIVVKLKSGGPLMTVTAHGKDAEGKPRVTCTWFDNDMNEKNGAFPVEALEPYTPPIPKRIAPTRVNRRI